MFAKYNDFSEFCSTFGTPYFEKTSNTKNCFQKMMKNLPIITITLMTTFGTKNVHSAQQADKNDLHLRYVWLS